MAKYHCDKCNKELEEVNFYKYNNGWTILWQRNRLTTNVTLKSKVKRF